MKKIFTKISLITGLILGFLLLSGEAFSQTTETFDGSGLTGTYLDGSFTGAGGQLWTYGHSRDEGAYAIDGAGIMIRRASDSYLTTTFTAGLGTISFDYRKAFTGGSVRQLELIINGSQVMLSPEFGTTSSEETTVYSMTYTANLTGSVTVLIKNVGTSTTNKQITLDNIIWEPYSGGGLPTAVAPIISPASMTFTDPVTVTMSTTTPGATIYYTTDGSNPTTSSTAYTTPISVSSTSTIKAMAVATGFTNSPVSSATYTYQAPPTVVTSIAALRGGTIGETYTLTSDAVLTLKSGPTRYAKYIQDATGAILIDDASQIITTTYNVGDIIPSITGKLADYHGMLQFLPTINSTPSTSTGTVTPLTLTLSQLSTTHQAKLVTVKEVTFSASGNFASGTNYTVTDPSGTGVVRLQYGDLPLVGSPIPTVPQDITGVLLQYDDVTQLVPISMTPTVITTPTLMLAVTSVSGFDYTEGAGPSAEKIISVTGTALTAPITVTASAGFEISLSTGSQFVPAASVTLPSTGGSVYVRMAAGLTAGNYTGTLTFASTGATSKTVSLSGTVYEKPVVGGVGFENFNNLTITGTNYKDGTFVGQDGSNWTFVQSRGDIQITDKSIMLGRNRPELPTVYSGILTDGVGVLSFDYMQAFSANVDLLLYVNDVLVGNFTSTSEQNIVKSSGNLTVNVNGPAVIRFVQASSGAGQVAIDNVAWTKFGEGGAPDPGSDIVISDITLSPDADITTITPVDVSARVTSTNPITSVNLFWGPSAENLAYMIPMVPDEATGLYVTAGSIPGQPEEAPVYYQIVAADSSGAVKKSPVNSYNVGTAPPVIIGEIAVDASTITPFTYVEGENVSDIFSFTVSGTSLAGPIQVTAPYGFEISLSPGDQFSPTNQITFNPLDSVVEPTTVYVRLKPGLITGDYSGDIIVSAPYAESKTILAMGTVTANPLGGNTLSGQFKFFNATEELVPSEYNGSTFKVQLFSEGVAVSPVVTVGYNPLTRLSSSYTFNYLEADREYKLRVWEQSLDNKLSSTWTWNNWGGITAADALIIQYMAAHHPEVINFPWIALVDENTFTDYMTKVADINNSSTITSADALLLLNRAVGDLENGTFDPMRANFVLGGAFAGHALDKRYPFAPEYKFVQYGDYNAEAAANSVYYEVDLGLLEGGRKIFNVYFTAAGDMNLSYKVNPLQSSVNSTLNYTDDPAKAQGKVVEIPVTLTSLETMGSATATFTMNSNLELLGIESNSTLKYNLTENGLRIGLFNMGGIRTGEALFTLKARISGDVGENYLTLTGGSEFTNARGEAISVTLTAPQLRSAIAEAGELTHKFFPNPFSQQATLTYNLPGAGTVKISIIDAAGRLVRTWDKGMQQAGTQTVDIQSSQLSGEGMYIYQIQWNSTDSREIQQGKFIFKR